MDIQEAVERLCPDLSKVEIEQAISCIRGDKLIQHGNLRSANYNLPFPKGNSKTMDALWTLIPVMRDRIQRFAYIALASTQLGLSYPLIAFLRHGNSFGTISHPTVKPVGTDLIYRLESCGSLEGDYGVSVRYITSYPAVRRLTYTTFLGEKETVTLVAHNWIMDPVTDFIDGGVADHEYRHLSGLTSADGYLLDPKTMKERLFDGIDYELNRHMPMSTMEKIEQRANKSDISAKTFLKYYLESLSDYGIRLGMLVPKLLGGYRTVRVTDYI